MIVYMIKNKVTGLWYKKGFRHSIHWVEQDKASVWSSIRGPTGAIREIKRKNKMLIQLEREPTDPEIIELNAIPKTNQITIVTSREWEGLYINEKLVEQGFISLKTFAKALGYDNPCPLVFADEYWLECIKTLPENLKDVVKRGE